MSFLRILFLVVVGSVTAHAQSQPKAKSQNLVSETASLTIDLIRTFDDIRLDEILGNASIGVESHAACFQMRLGNLSPSKLNHLADDETISVLRIGASWEIVRRLCESSLLVSRASAERIGTLRLTGFMKTVEKECRVKVPSIWRRFAESALYGSSSIIDFENFWLEGSEESSAFLYEDARILAGELIVSGNRIRWPKEYGNPVLSQVSVVKSGNHTIVCAYDPFDLSLRCFMQEHPRGPTKWSSAVRVVPAGAHTGGLQFCPVVSADAKEVIVFMVHPVSLGLAALNIESGMVRLRFATYPVELVPDW